MATLNAEVMVKPTRHTAGQDARLYGERDARRYAKQKPAKTPTRTIESGAIPVTPSARGATRVFAAISTFL
jgi:hypothetical protein